MQNLRISIDIVSYFDMCGNCQTTFLYDIIYGKQLQRNILLKIIKDAFTDSKHPFKERLTKEIDKDAFLSSMPPVSLFILGLESYGKKPGPSNLGDKS